MVKALSSAQARKLAAIWSDQNAARVSFPTGVSVPMLREDCALLVNGWIKPSGMTGPLPNPDYEWREHWLTKAGLAALADYFGRLAKQ